MSESSSEITQIKLESGEEKFTPMEILWKYLAYLPYFIVSIAIALGIGISMNRYTPRVYKADTRVFVTSNKDNKIGGSNRSGEGDLIESALFSNKQINLDNELVLITRAPLIQRIVLNHHFNHYYYTIGSFRSSEVYGSVPFEVVAQQWADSNAVVSFKIKSLNITGAELQYPENKTILYKKIRWDQPFALQGNLLTLKHKPEFANSGEKNLEYQFTYKPPAQTVSEILSGLVASPYSNKTTIIKLELKGANVAKSAAILDALVEEYNQQSLDDKSKVLNNTINFINQRLDYVTKELGVVETDLKDFKQGNKLVDLPTQSGMAVQGKNAVEIEYTAFGVKEQLFKMLSQQIRKMPLNDLKVIPATLGLDDKGQKMAAIDAYNTLILKKLRDEPMLGKKSPILADLNLQVQNAYKAVLQSIADYETLLTIEKANLMSKMRAYDNLVGEAPGKEKTFVEIKRQQSVKEGLYLYLLQKREESAIASSTAIGNYEQLEPAGGSNAPIEPQSQKVLLYALIIGAIIPIGVIYLKDLFDDKISSRQHITSKTKIPIVAEIGHVQTLDNNFVVADKSRNITAEQFRILRTNLLFLLQDKQIVLVTSTLSGEGKSFIALNLAAVLAISNKKVALLEFDLRKPRIIKNAGLEKRNTGLSNYLAKQTDQLDQLFYTLDNYPSLHIFGCGPIPPNPAELMIGERMDQLFSYLRTHYDYVIIDSAPVGLVSDSFSISKFCDSTLFVVRQKVTLKKQLFYIDEIYRNQQLKNMGLVMNDVRLGAKHGYYGHHYGYGYGYGYRYGKRYGYGKGYGYGYGHRSYGEYFDAEKETGFLGKLLKRFNKK